MRADRLLSLLMLLQTRGRLTAAQLSKELEVSKRTIYRDIDSLSISGIPVYADGGPGGGYSLLDSYKTDLTGLTKEETEALFLLSIPGPAADLKLNKEMKNALLKLSSSLPADLKKTEDLLKQRIHFDTNPWFQRSEKIGFLEQIQESVWNDRKIKIIYSDKNDNRTERIVSPFGLVAKAGIWYLIADTVKGYRVFKIARILEFETLEELFERPENFLLEDFWHDWCSGFERSLKGYKTVLKFSPEGIKIAESIWPGLKKRNTNAESEADGWKTVNFTFANIYEAAGQILEFGPVVKVIKPAELQKRIQSQAHKIVELYKKDN